MLRIAGGQDIPITDVQAASLRDRTLAYALVSVAGSLLALFMGLWLARSLG